MNSYADKSKKNKALSDSRKETRDKNENNSVSHFSDNRPETVNQLKLQESANNSQQVSQLEAMQLMADQSNGIGIIQKKENSTGLPDDLKTGMENLSGYSMDDVNVHYNSNQPAEVQAHAYAQGTDIHLGPGQEKHLPHELGHVVQQKEGLVKPTKQLKGNIAVNDDPSLENEADIIGTKALSFSNKSVSTQLKSASNGKVVQKWPFKKKKKKDSVIGTPFNVESSNNQDTVPINQPEEQQANVNLYTDEEISSRIANEENNPAVDFADKAGGIVGGTGDAIGSVAERTFKNNSSGENGTNALTGIEAGDKSQGLKDAEAFSAGFALAGPVLSFYVAVNKLGSGEVDQKIEGAFEMLGSVSSGVKAGADLAKTINPNDAKADVTSAVAGSVTDGLAALKDGVLTVKKIYDTYKAATSEQGSSKRDKITAGLDITKGLLSSASGTIKSLSEILNLFKAGSAGMANAIPGLGIALSAVQIAIDVYEIMKAKTNVGFIDSMLQKNQWEDTLGDGSGKEKRQTQDDNTKLFEDEIERFSNKIFALNDAKSKLEDNEKYEQAEKVDEKIKSTEELKMLAEASLTSLKKNTALTNLKQVNNDRVSNAGFDIGVELTNIVGSVLSLVPEPGCQAASVALKAAASGASIVKKIGDGVKQKARDYAEANPNSKLNSIVDTSRSSAKEAERKKGSVRYIFNSILLTNLENEDEVKNTTTLIETSGMSANSLAGSFDTGGVNQAIKDLIAAQS